MKNNIISVTFLFLLVATVSLAQDQNINQTPASENTLITHSVNLTFGYYSPAMNYWNDTYLSSKGISETFDGNLAIGANITFLLPAGLRTRVGASFWSEEVNGTAASTVDGLKIGFTRFNLGLFYAPGSFAVKSIQPYLGVEGQVFLVKNKYDIDDTRITQQGYDMSVAPVLGIDRSWGHFNCGLEVKYNLGNYIQEETFESTVEHEVSVNGTEISLSIGYKF